MTMHIIKGFYANGYTKKNILSKNDEILERERMRHNKDMRRKSLHELQCYDLASYKKYLLGKKAVSKSTHNDSSFSWGKTDYRRSSNADQAKSLNTGASSTAKADKKEYTGDLVKGISTLHKSNAVPVIDEEYAKEIARMRRG